MQACTRTVAAVCLLVVGIVGESSAQEPSRWLFGVNGAVQATSDFRDNVAFVLNAEGGDLNADYRVGVGRVVDAEAGARVWRDLVVGASVSYFAKEGRVDVDARLPHPFFFNRPRSVSGAADQVRRTEVGVHVMAGWLFRLGNRMDLLISGGPSYIRLRQALVDQVVFSEVFPFNGATFGGVSTTRDNDGSLGVNAGADLTLHFRRHLGVGTRLRFSRASAAVDSPDGDRISLDVGGLQVMAGLRARF